MKKVLIIHAHPEAQSFNASLKDKAVAYLEAQGAAVKVSDLYAMNFNPVGGKHDFTRLGDESFFKYQMEQVHAYNHNCFADDVKHEMDKVLWADTIIFNFPLWWFSVPAILKGWIDRVFAMGFSYGAEKGVYDAGTFQDKTAFCTITTGGPEPAYGPEGKNGILMDILFPIHHGVFYFNGMTVLPPFVCFAPARIGVEARVSELQRYEAYLSGLNELHPVYKAGE